MTPHRLGTLPHTRRPSHPPCNPAALTTLERSRGAGLGQAPDQDGGWRGALLPARLPPTSLGGVLRRVLQHKGVARSVMVEIDGEVIRLSREFLPAISGDAWSDPRAEVIVGDGIDYVRRAPDGAFDAIIVDSTDPIGVGEVLFTDEFYANAARILGPGGLIVNQCGVPAMQADELRDTSARRAKFFRHVGAYVAAVPTYVGGFMTLGFAAKQPDLDKVTTPSITSRAQAAGILGTTQYWTPEVHAAAFCLPPYISRHLPR